MQTVQLRTIWLAIAATTIIILLAAFSSKFPVIAFKQSDALGDVSSRLGILFVLSIFAERTVQVYVSIFRNPAKQALNEEVRQQRVVGDTGLALEKNAELSDQRASTQKYSVLLALIIGILLGLSGVSLLQALVANADDIHGLVRILDILIVGGLIAGGSQPIHQIMETITDTFSLTRENLKTTTEKSVDIRVAPPQTPPVIVVPVQQQQAPAAQRPGDVTPGQAME